MNGSAFQPQIFADSRRFKSDGKDVAADKSVCLISLSHFSSICGNFVNLRLNLLWHFQ